MPPVDWPLLPVDWPLAALGAAMIACALIALWRAWRRGW